jgi:hypothetical protein
MISPRYLTAVCVLLALALVPTVIHSYLGVVEADGRSTAAIPASLAGYTAAPTNRDPRWGAQRFEATDWFERRYVSPTDEVMLTVLRSYDLKRLYHHPELDVAYGEPFMRSETHYFAAHPDIPIHVLYSDVERGPVALYALHYDAGFVADPLMFQLRSATDLLIRGRKPMTLLFARDSSVAEQLPVEALPVTQLLFAAIRAFTDTSGLSDR